MYISEYVTMINHDSYIITVQSNIEFDDIMNEEIEKIIDSIELDIDESIDSNFEVPSHISGKASLFDGVLGKALIGGATGALVGFGAALLRKKINKKNSTEADETNNTPTM